jgi:hypothetical protein
MAKIHTIHANGSLPRPTLWHKMHNYFMLVKNEINPRYKDQGGPETATVSTTLPFFWLQPTLPGGVGTQVLDGD